MCGIVGLVGCDPVTPRMVDALRRMEYRGYDSAGVAMLAQGQLTRRRAALKLLYLAIKNAGLRWRRGRVDCRHGQVRARVFRDRRADKSVDQRSYPAARVWPISKLCKGGPAAPACGGLDGTC